MIQAAAEDGVDLMVCSAYRSIEKQQQLFDSSVQRYMAQGMTEEEAYAQTATETAIPGTSEHQTGLAADIVTPTHQTLDPEFADTDAGKWLSEHAHEYGFVQRYPEDKQDITKIIYESWHYRFVGKTHAKLMKESGLCLRNISSRKYRKAIPASAIRLKILRNRSLIKIKDGLILTGQKKHGGWGEKNTWFEKGCVSLAFFLSAVLILLFGIRIAGNTIQVAQAEKN